MHCPHCNTQIDAATQFCHHCGKAIPKQQSPVMEQFSKVSQKLTDLQHMHEKQGQELQSFTHELAALQEQLAATQNTHLPPELVPELAPELVPEAPTASSEQSPSVAPSLPAGLRQATAQRQPQEQTSAPEESFTFPQKQTIRQGRPTRNEPPRVSPFQKVQQEPGGLEAKFGQMWLLVIGIIIMVFGVGYFLKYSFDQGWVGPAGRVAMAYVWGAFFLGAGELCRRKDYAKYGLSLVAGGISVLYFATYASFEIYALFSSTPSFIIMVLITTLAIVLSITYDAKGLAVLGLFGGFLTPILLSTGVDRQLELMTYITILNAGILATAFFKRWNLLTKIGFCATYLLYLGWYFEHYSLGKFWPAMVFLNIFFLIYAIIPFIYDVTNPKKQQSDTSFIATPNSFFAFGLGFAMISDKYSTEWAALLSLGYAALFLAMATWLFRNGRHKQSSFSILIANATLFLALTIPILSSGHWITVFWAVQGAVLVWLATRLNKNVLFAFGYGLMLLALGKFFLYDYPEVFTLRSSSHYGVFDYYFRRGYFYIFVERMITTSTILAMFASTAYVLRGLTLGGQQPVRLKKPASPGILLAGIFSLLVVLTLETNAFFHDLLPQARTTSLSVLWTMFSACLMVAGFRLNTKTLRMLSLWLFGLTLCKVFLVDMSQFSTPYRIISFIILGMVLVFASFLYHKFKDRLLPPEVPEDEEETDKQMETQV